MARFGDLVLIALALGADSFRASLGLGVLGTPTGYGRRLALAFAMCDGLALLLGLGLGRSLLALVGPAAGNVGPLFLAGYALYVLWPRSRDEPTSRRPGSRLAVLLPLTLSLDNLVAGGMLGSLGFPMVSIALLVGLTSGLMALAGLALGRTAVRLPLNPEFVGAFLLLVASVLSLQMGRL